MPKYYTDVYQKNGKKRLNKKFKTYDNTIACVTKVIINPCIIYVYIYCLYVYSCVYMYICMSMYMSIRKIKCICVCTYCTFLDVYVCICICMYANACKRLLANVDAYIYVCKCILNLIRQIKKYQKIIKCNAKKLFYPYM